MLRIALTAALLLAPLAGSLTASIDARADDWPRWRGPDGDGHSAEKNLLASWPDGGPEKLWQVDGLGTGFTAASVVGDRLYITGMTDGGQGKLHCFSTAGEKQWTVDYGSEWTGDYAGARSTPTVHDGRVYLLSGTGELGCFDAKDGKKLWGWNVLQKFNGRNIQWGLSESLLIDKGLLIVTPGGKNASVVALDPKTGKTRWTTRTLSDRSAYCSPTAFDVGRARVIATMIESQIVLLDAKSGRVLFTSPHKNACAVHSITPVFHKGILYCTSGYGEGSVGIQVGRRGIKRIWREKVLDCHHGGVVLLGNYIFGTSTDRPKRKLCCLDPRTGKVLYTGDPIRKGSVISAGGLLYCYGEDGKMALVKPGRSGFDEISAFSITYGHGEHWAHPAIADGRMYVRHGDAMACYKIAK